MGETYRAALAATMRTMLAENPRAFVIGQGVTDHKAVFGTTLGLADEFPGRVVEAPLMEEGMTGIAVGAALAGAYPIVTHIRVDFALLAMNQLVNLAAKLRYMSGGATACPMLVRTVIGRGWGQGAQHSQSLQSMFAHVPGLTVVMPATARAVRGYAWLAQHCPNPVVSLEHRLLYDVEFPAPDGEPGNPLRSSVVRAGDDCTVVATSFMVAEAARAAKWLAGEGIGVEVIDLASPTHADWGLVLGSVERTRRLVIADTGWDAYGVVAEACRRVATGMAPGTLRAPVGTVTCARTPCPTGKSLEDRFYPTLRHFAYVIAATCGKAGVSLPPAEAQSDAWRRFKGPF